MNLYASFSQTITHDGEPILSPLPFAVMYFDGPVKQHLVTNDEEGRLDIIAWREYKGDVSLAWFIREYNGILDPLSEIQPGMYLEIPQNVTQAMIRAFTYNADI